MASHNIIIIEKLFFLKIKNYMKNNIVTVFLIIFVLGGLV